MITHFFFHGFQMVATGSIGEAGPVSSVVAGWFTSMPQKSAAMAAEAFWWVHICLGLAFFNYVPYSKHIHILGALPNIFFRNLGQRGVMPKLNLEDENDWGVGKIEQFDAASRSWTSTRAPSVRAARTSARHTTPRSRCRRCISSTTCATR